jgi:hypothetical protein
VGQGREPQRTRWTWRSTEWRPRGAGEQFGSPHWAAIGELAVRSESRVLHVAGFRFAQFGSGCRNVRYDCRSQAGRRKLSGDWDGRHDKPFLRLAGPGSLGACSPAVGSVQSRSRLAERIYVSPQRFIFARDHSRRAWIMRGEHFEQLAARDPVIALWFHAECRWGGVGGP